jgi:23S rRNA (guanine745-N1)-methyltransferase
LGAEPPLACTVRGCGAGLERRERAFVCAGGHSFDVARSGYVNLLQPQDRRSLAAGDSKDAVEARARLLAKGVGRGLIDEVARRVAALGLDERAWVVELGSGSGEVLGTLGGRGIGLDLSVAAAEHAARRFPDRTWVVANADRRLPLLDSCVALVLSVHGRRNPEECARVLAPGGHLLAALPAPDDLAELRELVQGKSVERERVQGFLEEHGERFRLLERASVRERHRLQRPELLDLLAGTYRGERRSSATRVAELGEIEVTLASELLVLVMT